MKILHIAAAFSAAGLSTIAFAQTPPPVVQAPNAQRDLTRAEAKQRADLMFSRFDMNKDGTVTKTEAQAETAQYEASRGDDGRGAARMGRMIDLAFSSASSMNLAQFEAQALARFDAMDLNHDGTVSAAERAQLHAQRDAQ
jgi:Ca2+-binding EF-hand superfamily protein